MPIVFQTKSISAKAVKDSWRARRRRTKHRSGPPTGRMALVAIGDDGPSSERPESPLHLGDDETAQDDATEIGGGRKRKGKSTRWNIPSSALSMLEQMFSKDKFPSVETRKKIATDLKVTPRQVQVWFQNKRQRSTKPPGRPTDTRSILNTSVSSAEALLQSLVSHPPAVLPRPLALHTRTGPPPLRCNPHWPPSASPAPRPPPSLAPQYRSPYRVCTFIPHTRTHAHPCP